MTTPMVETRYLTTRDAAKYLGVCEKTFKRMLGALPAAIRPCQVEYPGVSVKRWRIDDLDKAFAKASASSDWDALIEQKPHLSTKRRKRSE